VAYRFGHLDMGEYVRFTTYWVRSKHWPSPRVSFVAQC
jgi:hypothetical protein